MARSGIGRAAVLGAGVLGLLPPGAARAQMPPEAAEIGRCLCTRQEISRLSAAMSARMAALRESDARVAALDARLRRERPGLDVNDPAAVEHYKALLERRDSAWKASVGPVWRAANAAVARYNRLVRRYNGNCGHRLFDSALLRQVRATLTCQAPGYPPPPAYAPPGPPGPPGSEYLPPAPPEAGFPPPPATGFPPPP